MWRDNTDNFMTICAFIFFLSSFKCWFWPILRLLFVTWLLDHFWIYSKSYNVDYYHRLFLIKGSKTCEIIRFSQNILNIKMISLKKWRLKSYVADVTFGVPNLTPTLPTHNLGTLLINSSCIPVICTSYCFFLILITFFNAH